MTAATTACPTCWGAAVKFDAREIANSLGGDVSGDSAHKPALGPLGNSLDDFVA